MSREQFVEWPAPALYPVFKSQGRKHLPFAAGSQPHRRMDAKRSVRGKRSCRELSSHTLAMGVAATRRAIFRECGRWAVSRHDGVQHFSHRRRQQCTNGVHIHFLPWCSREERHVARQRVAAIYITQGSAVLPDTHVHVHDCMLTSMMFQPVQPCSIATRATKNRGPRTVPHHHFPIRLLYYLYLH